MPPVFADRVRRHMKPGVEADIQNPGTLEAGLSDGTLF